MGSSTGQEDHEDDQDVQLTTLAPTLAANFVVGGNTQKHVDKNAILERQVRCKKRLSRWLGVFDGSGVVAPTSAANFALGGTTQKHVVVCQKFLQVAWYFQK